MSPETCPTCGEDFKDLAAHIRASECPEPQPCPNPRCSSSDPLELDRGLLRCGFCGHTQHAR